MMGYSRSIILCAVFLLFLSVLPVNGAITAGPWLQKVGPHSITIMWETDSAGESIVEVGLNSGLRGSAPSVHSARLVTIHEVEVTGLKSNTEYRYRVRTGADLSEWAVLRTAPVKGNSDFRFAAYGDSRTNEFIHGGVAVEMESNIGRTFIVNSGDIVPSSSSGRALFREDFFQPLARILPESSIFVARGNHETTSTLFTQYLAHPSQGSGSEDYFSFDYGNVHVIVLDTTQGYSTNSPQKAWLEADLSTASADPLIDWIFVAFHHPPYSTGQHGSNIVARIELGPLFETYGVDIVFNGHDHNYERIVQQNGVVYIVTGGGGARIRDQGTPRSWSVIYHKLHHFVTVDVNEDALTVIAHGAKDSKHRGVDIIDSVVITKDPAWSPTANAGPDQVAAVNTMVTLDGSASYDGEGDPFTYEWTQVSGPPVSLFPGVDARPTFTPAVPDIYAFQLVCTEGDALSSVPDEVRIGVKDPASGGSAVSTLVEDTFILIDTPDQNYGALSALGVDGSPWAVAYLRFSVPAVEGKILSVKLRLFCFNESDVGGYVRIFSDRRWSEDSPTWNNPLAIDGPVVGHFGAVSPGWVEADVTAAFPEHWRQKKAISMAICPTSSNGADYHSKEGANPPKLIVTYAGEPVQKKGKF